MNSVEARFRKRSIVMLGLDPSIHAAEFFQRKLKRMDPRVTPGGDGHIGTGG